MRGLVLPQLPGVRLLVLRGVLLRGSCRRRQHPWVLMWGQVQGVRVRLVGGKLVSVRGAQRAGQAVQAAYRVGKPVVQGGVRAAGAVGVGAAVAGRGLSHVDQVAQRTEALLGGALGTEGSYHGQIRR